MIRKKRIVEKVKKYFLSERGGKKIPYRTGSYIIKYFCRTSYAREKYFNKKVKLFSAFLDELNISEGKTRITNEMLGISFLKPWRVASFSNFSDRKFKKYVNINNHNLLKESCKKGQGVILLSSHFGLAEMNISIFPRIGYHDFHTIVGTRGAKTKKFTAVNPSIKPNTLIFDKGSLSELFKVLMEAKQILTDGGIVHILGDGYQGKSSITFPFIGKLRSFRKSYAELALSTDADIIPIFIYPDKKNHINVDLYPILDNGNDEMSREDRVQHIVQQYVNLLSEKWLESPQYINQRQIENFLQHIDEESK